MSDPGYFDEFGFYSPMPLDRAARPRPEPDFPTGPGVGSQLPPIRLPDQHGVPVDVGTRRGGQDAIIVFHRSAYW